MWSRRFIVLVALGLALSRTYRQGLRDFSDDLAGWEGFVTVWLPAAILLGLGVSYVWPWVTSRWRHQHRR